MSQPLQAFLDSGTSFEGKVAFSGAVRIDGHFKGDASADGMLIIGETGVVEADLEVGTLVVEGVFSGSVQATQGVEVAARGRVEGHVSTERLRVAEGGQLNATVRMQPTPARAAPAAAPGVGSR